MTYNYEFIKGQMIDFWNKERHTFNSDVDVTNNIVESLDMYFDELDEMIQCEIIEKLTIHYGIDVPTHTLAATDDIFVSAVYMICDDDTQPMNDLFIFIFDSAMNNVKVKHIKG